MTALSNALVSGNFGSSAAFVALTLNATASASAASPFMVIAVLLANSVEALNHDASRGCNATPFPHTMPAGFLTPTARKRNRGRQAHSTNHRSPHPRSRGAGGLTTLFV